jgi:hypothetical protein
LRGEFVWAIASGVTIREMYQSELSGASEEIKSMKPSQYILLSLKQDREAAHRWNLANSIRKESCSVSTKIIKFLRSNVGRPVTGEELRYVAGDKTEWARRVRELRTEYGWPVVTKVTGRPDLPIGTYVLEADKQGPVHDRKIPDAVRHAVFHRDGYKCRKCGWIRTRWSPKDPRHWELHHISHHKDKGKNEPDNLMLLCNKCHDILHRKH